MSHPSRVRGLKLDSLDIDHIGFMSHPSRVRGLKLEFLALLTANPWSHPSRVRGLKLFVWRQARRRDRVAPLAGAWIET